MFSFFEKMTQRELQKNSPYLAGMTGYGFMLDEMNRILSLLMADNSDALLKQEIENNELLLIATKITRSRAIPEFKRYSRFSLRDPFRKPQVQRIFHLNNTRSLNECCGIS